MTTTERTPATCSVCSASFVPRMSYQIDKRADGATQAYCSLPCRAGQTTAGPTRCDVCGSGFALTFAYQAFRKPDGAVGHVCSEACRAKLERPAARQGVNQAGSQVVSQAATQLPRSVPAARRPYRVAVLNQKGGTGKTTTSINVAAGLAEAGGRVLLVDADPQGNVGVSLGVNSPYTLYHVLVDEVEVDDAVVPINKNLDVLTSDDTLAAAEIKLAQHPGRGAVLQKRLEKAGSAEGGYTHVVIDCGPSLSLINQNALCFADEVLVPVACDYLSLVGVKQVLKTVKSVNQHLGHPLKLGGVVPTFYDARAKICRDALEALRKHFGDLCLPPVRQNTKLKEAPSHKKTIFEHDPLSPGAEDYRVVVDYMVARARMVSAQINAARGDAA